VGQRDPGYWDTSRMVLEAALCFVLDGDAVAAESGGKVGVLTPASGLGRVFLRRLEAAGFGLPGVVEDK